MDLDSSSRSTGFDILESVAESYTPSSVFGVETRQIIRTDVVIYTNGEKRVRMST